MRESLGVSTRKNWFMLYVGFFWAVGWRLGLQHSSTAEEGQNKGSFAIFTFKDNVLNCFSQKNVCFPQKPPAHCSQSTAFFRLHLGHLHRWMQERWTHGSRERFSQFIWSWRHQFISTLLITSKCLAFFPWNHLSQQSQTLLSESLFYKQHSSTLIQLSLPTHCYCFQSHT